MPENRKPPVSNSEISSTRPDRLIVRHRARPQTSNQDQGAEIQEDGATLTPDLTGATSSVVPLKAPAELNDGWDGSPRAFARENPEDNPQAQYRYPLKDMRYTATVEDDDPVIDVSPETTTDREAAPSQDWDTNEPTVLFAASPSAVLLRSEPEPSIIGTPTSLPDGPDSGRCSDTLEEDGAISDPKSTGNRNYTVGRGRPPKESQFKKGQSGNPKGRPKGARNSTTIVTELLNTRLASKVNGQPKKMLTREALFSQQLVKGLKGDLKSTAFLLQFDQPDGPSNVDSGPAAEAEISASERALLAHMMIEEYRSLGLTNEQIIAILRRQGLDPDGEGQ